MQYLSVDAIARKWGVAGRTVRNYCHEGKIPGAILRGKTWYIPEDAARPKRINQRNEAPETLLLVLRREKQGKQKGGIYHKLQIELTYNSNHMEGSRLTHDQTRYIYDTHTIGLEKEIVKIDDILETVNHFRCIDLVIDQAMRPLSEELIKKIHRTLKSGTSDSEKSWFTVGGYKKFPNEVGGHSTAPPEEVSSQMKALLNLYHERERAGNIALEDLLEFHYAFERIHPFQDGNGRVGRLLLLKECLHYSIVPFIIDENHKLYYYRGLEEWNMERGYLRDTCLSAQDQFKSYLDYFRISYSNQEEN